MGRLESVLAKGRWSGCAPGLTGSLPDRGNMVNDLPEAQKSVMHFINKGSHLSMMTALRIT